MTNGPVAPRAGSAGSTRRAYQLLDAHTIATSYFDQVEVTPTQERQLRPLKVLLKVAHGAGARIPEVWEIAVKLADGGQPTHGQVTIPCGTQP